MAGPAKHRRTHAQRNCVPSIAHAMFRIVGERSARGVPVIPRCFHASARKPQRISDSEVSRLGAFRAGRLRTTDRRASSALFFDGAGAPVSLFPFPQKGNGAPGGARGLRGPFGPPLRSGGPRADVRERGCEARPRARAPRLRQVCEACRPGAAPPGAPSVSGMSPRAPSAAGPSRLETGKD